MPLPYAQQRGGSMKSMLQQALMRKLMGRGQGEDPRIAIERDRLTLAREKEENLDAIRQYRELAKEQNELRKLMLQGQEMEFKERSLQQKAGEAGVKLGQEQRKIERAEAGDVQGVGGGKAIGPYLSGNLKKKWQAEQAADARAEAAGERRMGVTVRHPGVRVDPLDPISAPGYQTDPVYEQITPPDIRSVTIQDPPYAGIEGPREDIEIPGRSGAVMAGEAERAGAEAFRAEQRTEVADAMMRQHHEEERRKELAAWRRQHESTTTGHAKSLGDWKRRTLSEMSKYTTDLRKELARIDAKGLLSDMERRDLKSRAKMEHQRQTTQAINSFNEVMADYEAPERMFSAREIDGRITVQHLRQQAQERRIQLGGKRGGEGPVTRPGGTTRKTRSSAESVSEDRPTITARSMELGDFDPDQRRSMLIEEYGQPAYDAMLKRLREGK